MLLNEEDYELLKDYASYKSDRTYVCEFTQLGLEAIRQRGLGDVLAKYVTEEVEDQIKQSVTEKVPKVKIVKKKVVIEDPTYEVLSYLDSRSVVNSEVKIGNFCELFTLIRQGFVVPDESFAKVMQPMDEESSVTELFSSNGGVRFRGKLWRIKTELSDWKVKDLKFEDAQKLVNKYKLFRDLKVVEFDSSTNEVSLKDEERGQEYKSKLFYVTPVMKVLFKKGNSVSLVTKKVYGQSEGGYLLINPVVVPKGFKSELDVRLKAPRSIPTVLYNAAYAEYVYRSSLGVES